MYILIPFLLVFVSCTGYYRNVHTGEKKLCVITRQSDRSTRKNGVNEYIDDNLIVKYSKGIAIAKDKICGFGVKIR